jgi:hypothetical protein
MSPAQSKLNDHHKTIGQFFNDVSSAAGSVGIALGYGLDGSILGGGWEFFSSLPLPERLWGPPSLISNGYEGFFPWR